MSQRMPKKPKLQSLPKRPKASASVSTWENFEKRCKEVQKSNAKKLADWKKQKQQIVSSAKRKEQIQKRTQGCGRL